MHDSHFILNSEAYAQGIWLHEILMGLFCIPYICYLVILYRSQTFLAMNRRIYLTMPITIFLLGAGLITGGFLLAMRHFVLDWRILCMIVLLSIFLVGEIYRMKSVKKARISESGMQRYRTICKRMYLCFLALFICGMGLFKM